MSFMFNPHPYDDPHAVNQILINEKTAQSIVCGVQKVSKHISELLMNRLQQNPQFPVILAMDGYIGAQYTQVIHLIEQQLLQKSIHLTLIDFSDMFKTPESLDLELSAYLHIDKEKDPVSLFGKLFEGGYETLTDKEKTDILVNNLQAQKTSGEGGIIIVYGCGCALKKLRHLYDYIIYFDLTPKRAILRARNGCFANLGDKTARPIKALLRRCYYVDFEAAGHLRWDLIKNNTIDFYIASDDPNHLQMIPQKSFATIMAALSERPFRCKPVYLEGVWGGQYIIKLRHLPDSMQNCAWVFDLIPLEVSIVAQAGEHLLEFPFFTFVQKEGRAVMGDECVSRFGGYFPIRFNYDDTFHSNGNMSVQVHSGHNYNIENFNELGRQDESYYVVATGHQAKTFIGFNENVDPDEFIREAKISEKNFTTVDYENYINHIKSEPGIQVMLPAGTVHASGRNQLILEIGSLTIGSYTYKMYDYLRADLDGIPRPIHTYHGERVLCKERTTSWVNENLAQPPRLVRSGDKWAEYIVGEHDLLYFSLRRLEFEKSFEDDTNGKFHVLTLVDGEKVRVQSLDHPELYYEQHYLDVVVVPANIGKYIIKNLGNQPVYMHKTMLRE